MSKSSVNVRKSSRIMKKSSVNVRKSSDKYNLNNFELWAKVRYIIWKKSWIVSESTVYYMKGNWIVSKSAVLFMKETWIMSKNTVNYFNIGYGGKTWEVMI